MSVSFPKVSSKNSVTVRAHHWDSLDRAGKPEVGPQPGLWWAGWVKTIVKAGWVGDAAWTGGSGETGCRLGAQPGCAGVGGGRGLAGGLQGVHM